MKRIDTLALQRQTEIARLTRVIDVVDRENEIMRNALEIIISWGRGEAQVDPDRVAREALDKADNHDQQP